MDARGRFAGRYPATGEYTSKVYDFGSTEMTSMALQMLATKDNRETIIDRDPVLILTVLRRLRQDDQEFVALGQKYAEYLPYCEQPSIYDPDGC